MDLEQIIKEIATVGTEITKEQIDSYYQKIRDWFDEWICPNCDIHTLEA